MSIVCDQQALSATKDALAKQVDLFEKAIEEGTHVEETVSLLAVGALLNFEFYRDSIGGLPGIAKPVSELEWNHSSLMRVSDVSKLTMMLDITNFNLGWL